MLQRPGVHETDLGIPSVKDISLWPTLADEPSFGEPHGVAADLARSRDVDHDQREDVAAVLLDKGEETALNYRPTACLKTRMRLFT